MVLLDITKCYHLSFQISKMPYAFFFRRRIISTLLSIFLFYVLFILTGVYQYLLVLPFDSHYQHAGPHEPLSTLIQQIEENSSPDARPINEFKYEFLISNEKKCKVKENNIRLVYVVKSALSNFYRREIIRQSWGFEQRFSDVTIRTVFLVGSRPNEPHLQVRLNKENKQHKDIVQADFVDDYLNNTIKAMMGFHWTFHYCSKAKYFLFVDDDYYVSTRNLLRFIRDPNNYPQYLETFIVSAVNEYQEYLYAGYVFKRAWPQRLTLSKWHVSLQEYPYSFYPPYVTAGAYVLSNRSLHTLYYATIYTKQFK